MKHFSLLSFVSYALLQPSIPASTYAAEELPRRPFVGVQVDASDEQVNIVRIVPGSSASRSELKVGNAILWTPGESFSSVTVSAAGWRLLSHRKNWSTELSSTELSCDRSRNTWRRTVAEISGCEPLAILSTTGAIGAMCLYAGESVREVKRVQPASEIVEELMAEMARTQAG